MTASFFSRALIRPSYAGASVLVLHLLFGIMLGTSHPRRLFQAEQASLTILVILPAVVDQHSAIPPIPEPVMRAPPLVKLVPPSFDAPSSPLDVMAVTIRGVERSDGARDDELVKADRAEAVDVSARCPRKNAVGQQSLVFGAASLDASCDRRGYINSLEDH
jgi:hypothetical protein